MHKKIIDYYWPTIEGQSKRNGNRRSIHEEWKLHAGRDGTDTGNPYFYALYHLAEHLDLLLVHDATDNISLDRLYQLARDEENFAKAQVEYLSDIDLPIKTIRFALSAAARADDAPSIAEFIITHARRVVDARKKESPLLMLRRGQGLEQVWGTCDLYDIDMSSLWYLLVAWELYDTGARLLDAKNTLKHLSGKRLVQVARFDVLMTLLLSRAYKIDRGLFEALYPRLLHHSDMEPLLGEMLKAKDFEMAKKICVKMADNREKSSALLEIAQAQAQAGDSPGSKATFESARKIADEIDDADEKSTSLNRIAQAQAQAGDTAGSKATLEGAKKIADEIDKDDDKSSVLASIAITQVETRMLSSAVETSKEILAHREHHLTDIANAIINAGGKEDFKQLLVPYSYDLVSAIQVATMLIKAYPEQSGELCARLRSLISTIL